MLKTILLGGTTLLVVFFTLSCSHKEESVLWLGPNWTPDGKIVFVEERTIFTKHWSVDGGYSTVDDYIVTLYQIDKDGSNLTPIAHLTGYYPLISGPGVSTSATDSLVIVSTGAQMLLVERKTGKLLKNLGPGAYADFSPDGKKIVYQKYEGDQPKGIWIMDLESGEERCLDPDEYATYPRWSRGGGLIRYERYIPYVSGEWFIADTLGNIVYDSFPENFWGLDWSASDTSKIAGALVEGNTSYVAILDLSTLAVTETTSIRSGSCLWSDDGEWFIVEASHNGITGYFIVNKEGTTWIPLQP